MASRKTEANDAFEEPLAGIPGFSAVRMLIIIGVVIIAAAGVWLWQNRVPPRHLPGSSIDAREAFSRDTGFIPDGPSSRKVSDALAVFNFPDTPPFFDDRHVTESLNVENARASSTRTYLSYDVPGKTISELRAAWTEYLGRAGWMSLPYPGVNTATTSGLLFTQSGGQDTTRVLDVSFAKNNTGKSSNISIGLFLHWIPASSDPRRAR